MNREPARTLLYCCKTVLHCAVTCRALLCCTAPLRAVLRRSRLAALCCAVLCCAVLCCAVLCCAVLCCAVLCCAVLCCAVLCCAVLCCAVLCCAALRCAALSNNTAPGHLFLGNRFSLSLLDFWNTIVTIGNKSKRIQNLLPKNSSSGESRCAKLVQKSSQLSCMCQRTGVS